MEHISNIAVEEEVCSSLLHWQSFRKLSFLVESSVKQRATRCDHRDMQVVVLLEPVQELLQCQIRVDLESIPESPLCVSVLYGDKSALPACITEVGSSKIP